MGIIFPRYLGSIFKKPEHYRDRKFTLLFRVLKNQQTTKKCVR